MEEDMSHCKQCRRLSYYKHGGNMKPTSDVQPIAGWCIICVEVYCGTGQLSFLSPRGGKYIEIPRGVRNRHGVLPFGGTYVHVQPEHLWKTFPFMSLRQAAAALSELREGGLIAERDYGGLDPDYRHWYTLTESGNAVA